MRLRAGVQACQEVTGCRGAQSTQGTYRYSSLKLLLLNELWNRSCQDMLVVTLCDFEGSFMWVLGARLTSA